MEPKERIICPSLATSKTSGFKDVMVDLLAGTAGKQITIPITGKAFKVDFTININN